MADIYTRLQNTGWKGRGVDIRRMARAQLRMLDRRNPECEECDCADPTTSQYLVNECVCECHPA